MINPLFACMNVMIFPLLSHNLWNSLNESPFIDFLKSSYVLKYWLSLLNHSFKYDIYLSFLFIIKLSWKIIVFILFILFLVLSLLFNSFILLYNSIIILFWASILLFCLSIFLFFSSILLFWSWVILNNSFILLL